MANSNCLEGMRCPKCRSLEPFQIVASSTFVFYDEGTDEFGDVDFEKDAFCRCVKCGFEDTVEGFEDEAGDEEEDEEDGE